MQAIDHAAEFKDMRFSSDEEEDAAYVTWCDADCGGNG